MCLLASKMLQRLAKTRVSSVVLLVTQEGLAAAARYLCSLAGCRLAVHCTVAQTAILVDAPAEHLACNSSSSSSSCMTVARTHSVHATTDHEAVLSNQVDIYTASARQPGYTATAAKLNQPKHSARPGKTAAKSLTCAGCHQCVVLGSSHSYHGALAQASH
jgi:uncharacterized protein involved in type VI secretion and phage assembly